MVKKLLIFASGVIVGGVGASFVWYTKNLKLIKKTEDRLTEIENFYKEQNGDTKEATETENDISKEEKAEESKKPEINDADEIRRKLNMNYEKKMNYAGFYDNEDEKEEEDDILTETEEMHEEHQANKNKKPVIIAEEYVGDLPASYTNVIVNYYTENEVLVDDESGEVLDPKEAFVGDCLNDVKEEDDLIFVLNYSHNVVYETTICHGAFDKSYEEY